MTTKTETITTWTCDRCETSIVGKNMPLSWGHAGLLQGDGTPIIYGGPNKHLCTDCSRKLQAWFSICRDATVESTDGK